MYNEEHEAKPKSISETINLFGEKHTTQKRKGISERAQLLKYFCDRALDRKGPIVPARMGYMLSLLTVSDLYYMKSVLESESKRTWVMRNNEPQPTESVKWNKLFWSMLKTK